MNDLYPCPCCGYRTRSEQPFGSFEICPVCSWEDDDVQARDIDYRGGANALSLREARANFAAIGASDPASRGLVRPPQEQEGPPVRPWG